MTPHLHNLVHVAVRSRFEGAQTHGHTRVYTYAYENNPYVEVQNRMFGQPYLCHITPSTPLTAVCDLGTRLFWSSLYTSRSVFTSRTCALHGPAIVTLL